MGGSISKVSCSDISIHHKKHPKPFRRPHVKIDKTKIGVPTDFRVSKMYKYPLVEIYANCICPSSIKHTYHVGKIYLLLQKKKKAPAEY